jgi:protein farnesyltransferase/geranylgeranyltransferase type-1 subunit alpha
MNTMNNEEFNFDDIAPIPIDEGDNEVENVALCKIMYTDEFKVVFSYLRALMQKNELSERALYVACQAILLVPAHYTVWEYKYRILEHLLKTTGYDIYKELTWCSDIAINNEKNYQIWNYRRRIVELIIDHKLGGDKNSYTLNNEYEIVNIMLEKDAKNYHVWSYKRWIVEYFQLFRSNQEVELTAKMISDDVRNNSAWNFRYFVIFGDNNTKDADIVKEVEYTAARIEEAITNPSSWNYMKFLYTQCVKFTNLNLKAVISDHIKPIVVKYSACVDKKALDQNTHRVSVPAFELLATIYNDEGDSIQEKNVYCLLGEQLDPVRHLYWAYKASQL